MRILITGGNGFLGSRVVKKLVINGFNTIKIVRSKETDLTNQTQTERMIKDYSPDAVIHLAASVGGIGANMVNPGKFFYDNIIMGTNLIHSCMMSGIDKFVMVGTVCSYPKYCSVPFIERDLWNGYPEETNAPYGIAKKALYVMLKAYEQQYGFNSTILIPCNLYGPGDNFDPNSSHVIPALIKKFVDAKNNNEPSVSCWGSGNATREFLYVDDAADAVCYSLQTHTLADPINLGGGKEIAIRDLAGKIGSLVGYSGEILWDVSKPDGQPRRFLNIDNAKKILNWGPKTSFDDGLSSTIDWYLKEKII